LTGDERGRIVAANVRRRVPWIARVAASCLIVFSILSAAGAQNASIHYVYDRQNRLVGVVDQQGNVAGYVYDAVGNLLRIDRVNADSITGSLGITFVTPIRGQVATSVQIFGKGFDATPSGNAVRFNGTLATVTEAAPNRLVTSVPSGATTGSITVTVATNTATSPSVFTIGNALAITPAIATVWMSGTIQFEATENGVPTTAVTWAVNGVTGGDASIGTISTTGLYSAPSRPLQDTTVTVTAVQVEDPASSASATVTVLYAGIGAASTSVSVGFAEPGTVNQSLTTAVSAVLGEPLATVAVGPNVSAVLAESSTFQASPDIATSWTPVVTSVSPVSAARGATNVSITLTGVGLAGATQLSFLTKIGSSFVADNNFTITDLSVVGDGTLATATISVSSTAVLGAHVVQIQVAGATSTQNGTGTNLFTVNP
jgi:YD repeat-containing protein